MTQWFKEHLNLELNSLLVILVWCRCFYLAQSYTTTKKWREASALYERVLQHIDSTTKEFRKVKGKSKVHICVSGFLFLFSSREDLVSFWFWSCQNNSRNLFEIFTLICQISSSCSINCIFVGNEWHSYLKTVDTIGNCQRPVFLLSVSLQ